MAIISTSATFSISANLPHPKTRPVARSSTEIQQDGTKDKIKKMFDKVELSVSPYDTAWVAMVRAPNSLETPYFPECSKWIVDNQLKDGSWGVHNHPSLVKDSISSTLACILALKRWNIGERQVNKGLRFIELNSASLNDQKQRTPIGFDIIFPGMLEHAKELGLNLPLESKYVESMLFRRDLDLKSGCGSNTEGRNAYLAYISEGIGKSQDWNMVMKYQRKNGSIFNSPSATASAFSHLGDPSCLGYLQETLKKFGNAVPTVYPLDIYARLCMVDTLESLGIGRLFQGEINSVLDETYRYWLEGNEEIFRDCTTSAMAFRILRANGYDVSSDKLNRFTEDHFFDSLEGYIDDIRPALELYKASQILYRDELFLEKQISWTSQFLKQKLSSGIDKHIAEEVQDVLSFASYADLERVTAWRTIGSYRVDETKMLETSYRCSNVANEHFLELAVEDFNFCQSMYREELEHLKRWALENRLDKLKFIRQKKLGHCYFSCATTLFAPEMTDARFSWARNAYLTMVIDDFFDVAGSEEELINLVDLIERWDIDENSKFCSEDVEILFSALHSTVCELGEKAFAYQGRNMTIHMRKIWLDLVKAFLTEALWWKSKTTPTLDEYMANGYTSFALGPIVLITLFFVGPKLTDEDIRGSEWHNLFETMSTCGRLLNDWRGLERENEQGKFTAVSLHMMNGNGFITEEKAIEKMKSLAECKRRELLRLVLREKDSTIPRCCKDLFWKMSRVLHFFYSNGEGFSSHYLIDTVNALFTQPASIDRS